MTDILTELVRLEVRFAKVYLKEVQSILDAPPEGAPNETHWSDYGLRFSAYALAHLHVLDHPENPHRGDERFADLALKLVDKFVEDYEFNLSQGRKVSTGEWPHFVAAGIYRWLGDLLTSERKTRWLEHEEAWANQAMRRPFGKTAPNHDAWRFASLYRLGQVLDRPDWREAAIFLARQIITYQTPEGFWEEGRHHGPSNRYNFVMLSALAWLYRLSGDEEVGDATRRLAAFVARYTYPDGTTVGAFDGRQGTGLGASPICVGLELIPEGRTLNRRMLELWREAGSLEQVGLGSASRRGLYRHGLYFGANIEYYSQAIPVAERELAFQDKAELAIDPPGTLINQSNTFNGLMHRTGSWVVTLSGQNSDVPHIGTSIYRLERQSRIELWHADARLIVGGGHNLRERPLPHATCVLDTGNEGETQFGFIGDKNWRGRYGYYAPRLAEVRMDGEIPELRLVFANGTVVWRVSPRDDDTCRLQATWEILNVERFCLQLPIVFWRGAELRLDGEPQKAGGEPLPVDKIVEVSAGIFEKGFRVTLPDAPAARLHPVESFRSYNKAAEDDPFKPHFELGLLSCQWTDPPRRGEATFEVEVV